MAPPDRNAPGRGTSDAPGRGTCKAPGRNAWARRAVVLRARVPGAPDLVRESLPPDVPDGWRDGRALQVLFERARAGDAEGFRLLTRRLAPTILRSTHIRVSEDEDLAQDAVQEAFLAAWQKLSTIRDAAHLKNWLRRVAQFRAIEERRRRMRGGRRPLSLDSMLESGGAMEDGGAYVREPGAPGPAHVDLRVDRGVLRERTRRAVSALPPTDASILRLYYLRGLSTREIARLLDVRTTAVKARLHRARARLRELFEAQEGDTP